MSKTVKEWFESVQDETLRNELLNELKTNKKTWANEVTSSLKVALIHGFSWGYSLRGGDYWKGVYENINTHCHNPTHDIYDISDMD